MKTARLLLLLVLPLWVVSNVHGEGQITKQTQPISQLDQEAMQLSQQFGKQLKSILQASIVTSGPVEAMRVCKISAPQIAYKLSQEKGWNIARTSHKVRNPNNAPDAWEKAIIEQWQDKMARGAPLANLQSSAIIQQNGQSVYRFMKAIPTGKLCLNCHGTTLSGPVQNALQDLYPDDQATGFKKGQLRGAFTLQKPLNQN